MLSTVIFYGLWLAVSVLFIFLGKTPVFETLLRFFLGVNGISSCMAFMGHAFKSDEIANYIGWPAGNPFQLEVAATNLAFGVLGIMALWFKDKFWLAVIVGSGIFNWGAAVVHFQQIRTLNNLAPGNAGPALYMDIFIPIVGILLYFGYKAQSNRSK